MASARRLKEIADANSAAFTQSATEWWLAEAPIHSDLPAKAPAVSVKREEPRQDAVVVEPAPVYAFLTEGSQPEPAQAASFNWLGAPRQEPEKPAEIPGPKLAWDAQNSCFVNGGTAA